MKRSTKAAKAKTPGSRTRSRRAATKSAKQQQAKKPVRITRAQREHTAPPAGSAPRQSKQAAVIALLRRSEGGTVDEIVAATGWQPHTVRGLFSGTLKKKLGLELNSAQEADRGRVYRISDSGHAGEQARAGG
jgi:Protein of unknown function (DUF3489)